MILCLVCYGAVSALVGFVVYQTADPYGHQWQKEPWYTWSRVILGSLFWPAYLVFIFLYWAKWYFFGGGD